MLVHYITSKWPMDNWVWFVHEIKKYRQFPPTGSLLIFIFLTASIAKVDTGLKLTVKHELCGSTTMQITCGEMFLIIAVYLQNL